MVDDFSRVKILIAGRGQRVRRFIIPALRAIGIADRNIEILCLSNKIDATLHYRQFNDLQSSSTPDWIFNCVPAHSQVMLSGRLASYLPKTPQFTDTPFISAKADTALALELNSRCRIIPLEDWWHSPQFTLAVECLKSEIGPTHFHIEHFGIIRHFLALHRSISTYPFVIFKFGHHVTTLSQNAIGHLHSRKEYGRAKAKFARGKCCVYDELEVEKGSSSQHIFREIEGHCVTYKYTAQDAKLKIQIDKPYEMFKDFNILDKKSVHEFDKFISLSVLIRKNLLGLEADNYPLGNLFADLISEKRLKSNRYATATINK